MRREFLYTIIADYLGGTYISQVMNANPSEALEDWARSLPEQDLAEWRLDRDTLLAMVRDGSLVPLDERVNVWCMSGVDDAGEQILLNLVSTVQS